MYIADCGNNRVRKVTVSTDIITTIAGSGDDVWSDGIPATSAELFCVMEVALDSSGRATVALLTFISNRHLYRQRVHR